jgi:hypothetical protein
MSNIFTKLLEDDNRQHQELASLQPNTMTTTLPKAVVYESDSQTAEQQPVTTTPQPDTMPPRHHATTQPRLHDTMVETIRASVKAFGKEAATHRFTLEEKKAITDLIYAYQRNGVRTNENEITRIAVNFIVNDFQANGKSSILELVLKALKN